MTRPRSMVTALLTFVLITASLFYFGACSENFPTQSQEETSELSSPTLSKNTLRLFRPNNTYPQNAILQLKLVDGVFSGGSMEVPNGSSFHVEEGALSIPRHLLNSILRLGSVTLTMEVDYVKKSTFKGLEGQTALVYTFGPSGSKFDPPANAWFDFTDLGSPSAKVYYIDRNDQAVELKPELIDRKNKRLLLKVHHFSRYAVSW